MKIKEIIIEKFPLTKKIDCALDCYEVEKKRYVVFLKEFVRKDSLEKILIDLDEKTRGSCFTEWKTLIVVGKTHDTFNRKELFFFNNVSTFVVFYLVDDLKNKVYMNDSWIYVLGLNYKKSVRKINEIVSKMDITQLD